jgi:hypothetical protein
MMNETNLAINKFLDELRQALHGQNAGLIQDAVYDVESHFLYALEEHGTIDFKACADELGTPEEIAQQYIQLEQDAERFLKGPSRPKTSFNGFFEPLSNIGLLFHCYAFECSLLWLVNSIWRDKPSTVIIGRWLAASRYILEGTVAFSTL